MSGQQNYLDKEEEREHTGMPLRLLQNCMHFHPGEGRPRHAHLKLLRYVDKHRGLQPFQEYNPGDHSQGSGSKCILVWDVPL